MVYEVLLTLGAERDLSEIHEYIRQSDSPAAAEYVLDRLLEAANRLAESPNRGAFPPELIALGMREFRQIFFKPYRLIYQVLDRRVVVHLIADGRRDMPSLLARRLLGP